MHKCGSQASQLNRSATATRRELSSSNVSELDEDSTCNHAPDFEWFCYLFHPKSGVYQEVSEYYGLNEWMTKKSRQSHVEDIFDNPPHSFIVPAEFEEIDQVSRCELNILFYIKIRQNKIKMSNRRILSSQNLTFEFRGVASWLAVSVSLFLFPSPVDASPLLAGAYTSTFCCALCLYLRNVGFQLGTTPPPGLQRSFPAAAGEGRAASYPEMALTCKRH
ncbi:hypothetical protein EVAR_48926_1 [Eumeta japonica]|uniref:Uncharacterized protein n=1 Tax=Eumeta variegata TaxID=151549 RepID=A0A4C1YX00_EUMVA|nr:hypothetical protein EVAR_48926_1 [Eumeta japonica]